MAPQQTRAPLKTYSTNFAASLPVSLLLIWSCLRLFEGCEKSHLLRAFSHSGDRVSTPIVKAVCGPHDRRAKAVQHHAHASRPRVREAVSLLFSTQRKTHSSKG